MEDVITVLNYGRLSYSEYQLAMEPGAKTGKYIIDLPYQETVGSYQFRSRSFRMRIPEYFPEYALDRKTASGRGRNFHFITGSSASLNFVQLVTRLDAQRKAELAAPENFRVAQVAALDALLGNMLEFDHLLEVEKGYKTHARRIKTSGLVDCTKKDILWYEPSGSGSRRQQAGLLQCALAPGTTSFHGKSIKDLNGRDPYYSISIEYSDKPSSNRPWVSKIVPIHHNPKGRGQYCGRPHRDWCNAGPVMTLQGARFSGQQEYFDGLTPPKTVTHSLKGLSALRLAALEKEKADKENPTPAATATEAAKTPDTTQTDTAENQTSQKSAVKADTQEADMHPVAQCMANFSSANDRLFARVDLQIDFDANGAMTGWPTVLASAGNDSVARKLYANVMEALEGCGAMKGMENRQKVALRFGPKGFILERPRKSTATPAAVPKAEAEPNDTKPEVQTAPAASQATQPRTTENAISKRIKEIAQLATLAEKDRTLIAQTELTRLGCQPGPIDGAMGRKTRRAFERFKVLTTQQINGSDVQSPVNLWAMQNEQNPVCHAAWHVANSPDKLSGTWMGRNTCAVNGRKTNVNISSDLKFAGANQLRGTVSSRWKNRAGRQFSDRSTTVITLNGPNASAVSTSRDGLQQRYSIRFNDTSMSFVARSQFCVGTLWFIPT